MEILIVATMIISECCGVGLTTLFKAASMRGMSHFVFSFYFNLLNTIALAPIPLLHCNRITASKFKFPLLSRICALGIIGTFAQLIGYVGIKYTSPTMSSAMNNLTPAWTFIFAVIFRMEKLSLSSSSTRSKVIGTIVSISGAFMVVLYKGPKIISPSTTLKSSSISLHMDSSDLNWVFGGFLLALQHILYAFLFIIQNQMLQICPSPLLLTFASLLCVFVVAAPVCLIGEPDFNAWKLKPDIRLVALVYGGTIGGAGLGVLHLWCMKLKGPVYVAAFKPLTIAIAAAMATVFLGDDLHLGSVIGAVLISVGVYAVIWGKAKEGQEKRELISDTNTTPLLQ